MRNPSLLPLGQQKLPPLFLLLSNRDDACLTSLSNDDVTMTSSSHNVELHSGRNGAIISAILIKIAPEFKVF